MSDGTIRTPTDILEIHYGIVAEPGNKVECPKCGHDSMSIKADNTIARCFHPECNFRILPKRNAHTFNDKITAILNEISQRWRVELHRKSEASDSARKYLEGKRGIHPKVIQTFPIGLVPQDITSVTAVFDDEIERIREQEGLRDRESLIERIEEEKDKLDTLLPKLKGWLAFFYCDDQYRIVSIRFRRPNSKDLRSYRPLDSVGIFANEISLTAGGENLIVVEGEFNLLQLQSLHIRYFESIGKAPEFLPVIAAGSVTSADHFTIKKLCRKPIVIYDNDVSNAGKILVINATDFMTVTATTTPGRDSDLDSYIRTFGDDHGRAWASIQELLMCRTLHPRSYTSLQTEIAYVRDSKSKEHRISMHVAEIVKGDVLDRGDLFHSGSDAYAFNAVHKTVTMVEKSKSLTKAFASYGINASEAIFNYILSHLWSEAQRLGKRTEVHRFVYYDESRFTLYLFNHSNKVYRISPEQIDVIDNGMDGVLFASDDKSTPFEFDASVSSSLLDELILSRINFEQLDDSKALTRGECRLLVLFWLLGLFFPQLMRTKPILALIGPKGSAKSFTIRCLGKLLFGESFDVAPISRGKESDFDTFITNAFFVGIDNADSPIEWLADKLAVISTGGTIKKRTLFTTNNLEDHQIKAFAAITSRTPHFTRDDVNDRLLPLPVERLNEFKAESILLGEVMCHRNEIMSELMLLLQEVTVALRSQAEYSETGKFRIADFGTFCMKIAKHLDLQDKVSALFAKLSGAQTSLTIESDPLLNLLLNWLDMNIADKPIALTTADLHEKLCMLAEKNKASLEDFHTRNGFLTDRQMTKLKEIYQHYCRR